jgi:hypothetical protein
MWASSVAPVSCARLEIMGAITIRFLTSTVPILPGMDALMAGAPTGSR